MSTSPSTSSPPALLPPPECDDRGAVDLLLALLSVPGKSRDEVAIQETILAILHEAGISADSCTIDTAHKKAPGGGETGNLIVKLPGTMRGPRRLLMAHVDTVPICVGAQPYIDGEYIRSSNSRSGLGGDDRGGVAVVLTAIREILRQKLPHPPLTLLFPVQEEIGLCGVRYLTTSKLGKPALAFNWDGNAASMLCIGATGDDAITIEIDGIASHAGVHPELGVSAAAIAGVAIADLVQNGWHGLIRKGRNSGTSNIGVIHGGEATNVVMPKLTLRAEARSHNPKFRQQIVNAFKKAFVSAAKTIVSADGQRGQIRFHSELKYEAFRLPAEAPVVQAADTTLRALGVEPQLTIGNGGLDANWMVAHGIPTVTLGCGQRAIHTVNEHLHLPSFLQACRIAISLASARYA